MGSRTVSVTRERVGDEVFTGAARLQIGKFPNERAVDIQLRAECLSRFRLQDRIQVQIPALLTVDGLYIGQRNALSGEFQRSAGDRFIRIIACLDVKIPSRRLGIQDQISRRSAAHRQIKPFTVPAAGGKRHLLGDVAVRAECVTIIYPIKGKRPI